MALVHFQFVTNAGYLIVEGSLVLPLPLVLSSFFTAERNLRKSDNVFVVVVVVTVE